MHLRQPWGPSTALLSRKRESNFAQDDTSYNWGTVMRHHIICLAVFYTLTSACSAQFAPCKSDRPSVIDHQNGVTESTLIFYEPSGTVLAHVFVPGSDVAVPGIVFSHSSIEGPNTRVDLLLFAQGLARAGAASIVLDGTIKWKIPNNNSKQPFHLTACAAHWLLQNVNVDQGRLALAGPGAWVGSGGYYCVEGEPRPCYHSRAILNFGRTSNSELRNTEKMLTGKGRIEMARWTQHHLNLKEINPDWFEPTATASKQP